MRLLLITQQLDTNVLSKRPLRETDALSLVGMRVKEGDGLGDPVALLVGVDANAVAVALGGDQLGADGVRRDAEVVLDLDPRARVLGGGGLAARAHGRLVRRVFARAAAVMRQHADLRYAVAVGVDA